MDSQNLLPGPTGTALDSLIEQTKKYIDRSKSAATRKAYQSDWAHFSRWANEHELSVLPADPSTVAFYISDMASTYAVSTISRRLTAISKAHLAAGYRESPASTHQLIVGETLRGIRRTLGIAQKGKDPLLSADIRRLLHALPLSLAGLRDSAVLLLGYSSACRHSELTGLEINDLTWSDKGLVIQIRRSKTDQEGEGRKVAIPFGNDEATCRVRALGRWIKAARIEWGPVFRAVGASGRVSRHKLNSNSISWVIKRAARHAGMNANNLGGHSLRSGHVTQATRAGVPELTIMRQTGHRSVTTLRKYVREGELFTHNAAAELGL